MHRMWNYSERRKEIGRPPALAEVVELVLRMTRENPGSGYDRIQGALANLGHLISNTWVGSILKAHGIDPTPDRKRQSTWKSFLQAHWDVLAAVDFTAIEV
jgi:putative transposase